MKLTKVDLTFKKEDRKKIISILEAKGKSTRKDLTKLLGKPLATLLIAEVTKGYKTRESQNRNLGANVIISKHLEKDE